MIIKVVILVLFVALVISLFSGLLFLFRDQGTRERTVWSLGIRLVIAFALMAVLIYGLQTGRLGSKAPWDSGPQDARPADHSLQDIDKQK